MPVSELMARVPRREFIEWMVFYKIKGEPPPPPRRTAEEIFAEFDRSTGFTPTRGN